MKRIRISKTAFINCVLFFVFFPVPIIEQINESLDGIIKGIQILACLYMIAMAFIKRVNIGKLEILVLIFCLVATICTYHSGIDNLLFSISQIMFPCVIVLFWFYLLSDNISVSIRYIAFYLKIIIWMNAICMLTFPKGIVSSSVDASRVRACWLLGSKNHVVYSMPIILLFLTWDAMQRNKKKFFYVTLVAFFASVLCMGDDGTELFGGSSTAIIMALVFVLLYVGLQRNLIVQKILNIKIVSVCGLIFNMLICLISIGGVLSVVVEMLTSALGKDLSFSGRSSVWAQCLKIFMESPIIGSKAAGNYYLFGSVIFTPNEYSFWLNIMVRTGCVGLLLIFVLFFYAEKNKVINQYVYLYRIIFLLIMISGMVDVPYWETIVLVLLFRTYLDNQT